MKGVINVAIEGQCILIGRSRSLGMPGAEWGVVLARGRQRRLGMGVGGCLIEALSG